MTDLYDYFVTITKDNGETITILKDGHPDWLYDAVREAHDGEFPNDWRYEMCRRIASAIDEGYLTDEDGIGEFADGAVDIYNSDRLQWLACDLERVTYVDDAAAEYGVTSDGVIAMIGQGQYACIEQMASILLRAWQENQEES